MLFQILTLFPERYDRYFETGLPAKGRKKGLFDIRTVRISDYADPERNGRVDDAPYGGGPGMVMQIPPVDRALSALQETHEVVLFTPRGRLLDQKQVREFSTKKGLTLLSGYYEGVDERIAENLVDHQISIGRFILGSGDLAALCFIEAIIRLLPGYMGSAESAITESYENGYLEYPQYTRPAVYRNWGVPPIILSGNHQAIDEWRREKSLEITEERKDEKK